MNSAGTPGSREVLRDSTLEEALNLSTDGVIVYEAVRDEAGRITDYILIALNDAATEIFGLKREEVKGKAITALWPGIEQDEIWPHCADVVERQRRYHTEVQRTTPAGDTRYFDVTLKPYRDGFANAYRDTTATKEALQQGIAGQKQISQKIEESAQLLNAVLDTSPIAIVVYEAMRSVNGIIEDFRPIIVNKQALEISGFTAEQFLSTSFFQRTPGAQHRLLAALSTVVTERKPERFEHQVPSSGRWVTSITTPFGDGFIATSQDITGLKDQNKIIEEQAELFDGVLRSLQNGLTIFRIIRDETGELEDMEYIQVADSVERDSGRPREEIIGRRLRAFYPGIEGTDHWRAYTALVKTGEPQHFETHFTLSGYDNYVLNWITPLGDDKMVSVYYIVNDLKLAQRELEHKIAELRRSNDDLEQFASVASHDLQEPLRKVQSFGNMLEARYADRLGEEGRDLVRRMQSAAGRMRNLVTGLLDFASLSRGKNDRMSRVDAEHLIREIIFDLDHTLDTAGCRVQIEGTLPAIHGIHGQLRHLFHNLLTNAIKFRKPDVRPSVVIRAVPLQPADVAHLSPIASPAQYTRFEVTDNGIGFDPLYADKIFGLFERLHGMSEYQGTGIGLSICRRVAERHEGAIWADGVPGEGATFSVLLQKA